MTTDALIGLIMLLVLLGAIFIGVPISFTLLFLALVFGYLGMGGHGVRPRLFPDHRTDEGGAARGGAAVHLHGVRHRAGRHDAEVVHGVPPAPRTGSGRALSGRDPDLDRVRDGDRHRGRRRDRARHHGVTDHGQDRLRRPPLRRHHHGRRHARHPDSTVGDADRDGAGARRLGRRPLCGGIRARFPAGRRLHRVPDDARVPQSEARAAGAARGAGAFGAGHAARGRCRHRPPDRPHRGDARLDPRRPRHSDRGRRASEHWVL